MVNEKSGLWGELFYKNFVNVNVILNFKTDINTSL